jgi:hypothetical protein
VALHILESFSPLLHTEDIGACPDPQDPDHPAYFVSEPSPNAKAFDWRPPDLSPQGAWYKARVADLLYACCLYPDPGPLIEEGLLILRRHRGNYNAEGPDPTYLQLLWWMFPMQHWDDICEGSSMSFLVKPKRKLTPNSVMDEEQIVIAEEFLDELISLGVQIEVAPGEMVANGPLFCLPKPGQPGQWRILSDMQRGRQNEVIGPNPTVPEA